MRIPVCERICMAHRLVDWLVGWLAEWNSTEFPFTKLYVAAAHSSVDQRFSNQYRIRIRAVRFYIFIHSLIRFGLDCLLPPHTFYRYFNAQTQHDFDTTIKYIIQLISLLLISTVTQFTIAHYSAVPVFLSFFFVFFFSCIIHFKRFFFHYFVPLVLLPIGILFLARAHTIHQATHHDMNKLASLSC